MAKATVPTIPNTSTPEEVHAQLKETGCCIIEKLAPKSHMEWMLEELDPWFDNIPNGSDVYTGFKTQRFSALVAKSKASGELVMNPTMVETANLILGDRCDHIQLGCSHRVRIRLGRNERSLHRAKNRRHPDAGRPGALQRARHLWHPLELRPFGVTPHSEAGGSS